MVLRVAAAAGNELHPGQEGVAASALVVGNTRVGIGAVVELQRDGSGYVVLADKVVHAAFVVRRMQRARAQMYLNWLPVAISLTSYCDKYCPHL